MKVHKSSLSWIKQEIRKWALLNFKTAKKTQIMYIMRLKPLHHFSKSAHVALETTTQLTKWVQINKCLSCQTCLKTPGTCSNTDMNDLNSFRSALIFLFNSVGKMREHRQLPSVVPAYLKKKKNGTKGTKLFTDVFLYLKSAWALWFQNGLKIWFHPNNVGTCKKQQKYAVCALRRCYCAAVPIQDQSTSAKLQSDINVLYIHAHRHKLWK